MAGPGELVSDDPDIDTIGKKMSLGLQQAVESLHQEMKSLGQQQVESLQEMKSLLKVLVESQVNTQLQLSQIVNNTSITTGINCKNDKENQSASQSPLSSSITNHHQPGLASTSSTLLSTPENDTIITAGATDISAANMERQPTVTDNQEITQVITDDHSDRGEKTAEDGGQVVIKDILDGYEDLFWAARDGDWEVASGFLEENPDAITKVIASNSRTVLHVAIINDNPKFIEEIVNLMPPEILEYRKANNGYTALHLAAAYGFAKAAELMVKKNPKLLKIVDMLGRVPLEHAITVVTAGQRKTVEYLYSATRREYPSLISGDQGASILYNTIDAGFYDIASSIAQRFPELAIDQTKKVETRAMTYMAQRPFAFASGANHTFWQRHVYSWLKADLISELDSETEENNSPHTLQESLSQSSESTDGGDEENPVERFEGSKRDEIYPPENTVNSVRDKGKSFEWDTVRQNTLIAMFLVPYLTYYMIKIFFVFLGRFIWTSAPRIKQWHKQLYDDKVKHKQAKALVKNIFTPLKERMNKGELIDFFTGSNIMEMAVRHGSVEYVEVCLELFPFLTSIKIGGKYMIQMAIAERNESILNLIFEKSGKNKIRRVSIHDEKGNTVLHYAAKLAPSAQLNSISGAYLQMQREMQWFEGVKNMISEKDKFRRNDDGDTAHNIFTEKHKELKESGEKWLKDTSGSCMLVAALIATVAFASAFTVPGGNISDNTSNKNGIPVFLEEKSFMIFAVADALALFSSITSVLMFLAVYTSRYGEVDFLKSLPNKLILGLTTLFISMASVLVAFSASLFIVLGEKWTWALIPIVVFSCVPVTLFAWLQLPLFFDMVRSTYWGSLFREHTYISSLELNAK